MNQYFISGTSSGIGKALAEQALATGHSVEGINRRNAIEDSNYNHHTLDLSDLDKVAGLQFEVSETAETLILINNAGTLGEVKLLGNADANILAKTIAVNVSAPLMLCAHFIAQTKHFKGRRVIINISSGAAHHAIPSWSAYCGSKAAVSRFTEVIQLDHPDVDCMAIEPGVVDTQMQSEIRSVEAHNFPEKERFVAYKQNNSLASPEDIAERILLFANGLHKKPAVCFSLRDV